MGKQAIKRGVRILEEKSRLLSLGAQEQAGLLRRGHQRGVQVTPLRGSHRAKNTTRYGAWVSAEEGARWGLRGKAVGATTE